MPARLREPPQVARYALADGLAVYDRDFKAKGAAVGREGARFSLGTGVEHRGDCGQIVSARGELGEELGGQIGV